MVDMGSKPGTTALRGDDGFSLVEMLVVITVLGILAAIVMISIGDTKGASVASVCKTDVRSIETSAEAVAVKTTYPLGTVPDPLGGAPNPLLAESANGAVLTTWPTNPNYVLKWNGTVRGVQVFRPDGTSLVGTTGTGGCDLL